MSPLVRSLLALAALLAAATAQPTAAPEPKDKVAASQPLSLHSAHCKEFKFGNVSPGNTVNLSPQHYLRSSNGGHELLIVQDACRLDGSELVGESVTICNQDVKGAAPWANVDGLQLVHLRKVRWGCTDDCPEGVTISVVEHCDIDGVQSRFSHRILNARTAHSLNDKTDNLGKDRTEAGDIQSRLNNHIENAWTYQRLNEEAYSLGKDWTAAGDIQSRFNNRIQNAWTAQHVKNENGKSGKGRIAAVDVLSRFNHRILNAWTAQRINDENNNSGKGRIAAADGQSRFDRRILNAWNVERLTD